MSEEQASYVTLDVFSSEILKGNPLAIVKTGDCKLSQKQKQQIAKEFNFSETVFLHRADQDRYPRADIFTPVNEMEFAGHPIIGTGHFLFRQLSANNPGGSSNLTSMTKAGPVAVSYGPARQVVFAERRHSAGFSRSRPLASDVRGVRDTSPVVTMVKGVTYALVDLTERVDLFADLVPGASPELELDEGWAPSFTGIMYYRTLRSRPEGEITMWELHVRMIAVNLEDPACGSGSCLLGAYVALSSSKKGRKHRLYINQGSEMDRRSHIIVDVILNEEMDQVSSIRLAGEAAFVPDGKISVN
ncbi:PhzF family phenazine biosynthesis protein [Aspergillus alliaceus]|uniref:PhzF family phenazine biosynthesis protein n=1 Tax=Petromyces alliaceus TaxID=209559 RepID=UPI0012A520DF|nr:uncharacterized protein BDW43DRAFT_298675 [Aspergillus alliaceus]KAB8235614.1 hypothetical protein BDW43DRAFT_298675 [Aspergillus alliaceus]